jgi:hypothetical protein
MKIEYLLSKLVEKPKNVFLLFCGLQFIFWTLVPYLTRGTLNHDVLEGIAWGFEWQLGYDKHPPLTAWLLSAGLYSAQALGINLELAIYAMAQAVVLAAFYPIYRLSMAVLPERAAVVATTLLGGILFFNTRTMNLTPDTIQTPIWAWSIWLFYLAVTKNGWRHWLGLATVSALALWAKYSGVILIASQFMTLVVMPHYRHYLNPLKNPKVYLSALWGIVLFAPHLYWLVGNDFLPIKYAQTLVINPHPKGIDHLTVIFKYLATQLPLLVIPIAMLWSFKDRGDEDQNSPLVYKQNKQLISLLVFMPFILTLLQAIVTGQKVVGRWSTPYYCFIGILLVFMLGKKQIDAITDKQWHRYLATCLCVFFVILGFRHAAYYYAPYMGKVYSDVYYPTKTVTHHIEQFWTEKTNKPLDYIIGDRYWTTFVSVYAKSALPAHPHVFLEANSKMSPWIDKEKLNKKGGMIIWLAKSETENTLPAAYADLPRAQFVKVQAVPKNISVVPTAPMLIGIGFIPPLT